MPIENWQPISRADLENRLNPEIAALPVDLLSPYREHATEIAEQPCFRSDQYGLERVFLIARSGKRLLVFDDAEDEFAIGTADEDGVLRDWGLYGDLIDALRAYECNRLVSTSDQKPQPNLWRRVDVLVYNVSTRVEADGIVFGR